MDLLILSEFEQTTLDNLGAASQATMMTSPIENVNSNEDYGSGSVKGLRLDMFIKPEAILEAPPRATVMITPSGMTIPTVVLQGARKQNERFCWGDIVLSPYSDPAATSLWWANLHLKTARRFHSGDVISVVIVNNDGNVAFGAGAVGYGMLKAYVTED